MPKFDISFTPHAQADILNSYQWGLETWGEIAAEKWLRELYRCIYDRLTVFPESCPLAPESEELDGDVHQLIFLRYRVLFEVNKNLIVVLRVDGPFTGSVSEP